MKTRHRRLGCCLGLLAALAVAVGLSATAQECTCTSGTPLVISAGLDDNFSTAAGSVDDAPVPGPTLLQHFLNSPFGGTSNAGFDYAGGGHAFAHTFTWTGPCYISEAYLELRLRTIQGQVGNDHLYLWFTTEASGTSYAGIGFTLWQPQTPQGETVLLCLDLGNLPAQGDTLATGATPAGNSLLALLNTHGYLDLYIQDDTMIDYAKLILCCEPCQCGQWIAPPVHLSCPTLPGWEQSVDRCGWHINLGMHVCDQQTLTITPNYQCQPSDCQPQYAITFPPSPFGVQFSGSYDLSLAAVQGCIEVCITPICAGIGCEPCCFTICCPEEPCDCGKSAHIDLVSPTGWTTTVSGCGGQVQLPQHVCDAGILDMDSYFECAPPNDPDCPVSYYVTSALIGGTVGPFYSYTSVPIPLAGIMGGGCDLVEVVPYCADTHCPPYSFRLCCDAGSECACGEWGWPVISMYTPLWNGYQDECPGEVIVPAWVYEACEDLTIEPHYYCAPALLQCTSYMISVPQLGIDEEPFSSTYDLPLDEVVQQGGVVEGKIYVFCSGTLCSACEFTIRCE